ncbi:hypothetical protein MTR_8g079320 [Medicago truncatula]|uniref:Uncharacterized protein n=1 Tax=Medicago truncatula TaxID=3880 RepID=G7LFN6_MEDTR|nr:hypothetical protein MTR_8g079320 [Medicago truncatula]
MEMLHMYSFVFEDIGFKFPFTNFECDFLKALNVASSQLHPNCCAFMCGFEISCESLGFRQCL